MKKVLFVFAVAAAMVACCNKAAKTEGCEATCTEEVKACCDSAVAVCDSAVVEVVEEVVAE